MATGCGGGLGLQKDAKVAKELQRGLLLKAILDWSCEAISNPLQTAACLRRDARSLRTSRPSVAIALALCILTNSTAAADVQDVAVRVDKPTAWVGQRLSFFVELRSAGSFSGSASFDLPQLPGVLVMKIGSPVVGSQDLEGSSWFIQTHEFALFSQRAGKVIIPEFPVRFSRRDDFTGPVNDVQAKCPSFKIDIQRPPDSDGVGFLITTESLDVTETWDPTPGDAEVGAIFKRTIIQRTQQLPGMALAPISQDAPDGIRVYQGDATTNDKLERGDFLGERKETVTYLLQKPGELVLPELNYVWWNPKTETLESKQLPSVTFNVAAPLTMTSEEEVGSTGNWRWMVFSLAGIAFAAFQWRRIRTMIQVFWKQLNPPDQVAARRLLRACHNNDASAASSAWTAWSSTQPVDFVAEPKLAAAITLLQRSIFGPAETSEWSGDELAVAFVRQQDVANTRRSQTEDVALPPLNPLT